MGNSKAGIIGGLAVGIPLLLGLADYMYFRSRNKTRKEITLSDYFRNFPYSVNKKSTIDLLFFEYSGDANNPESGVIVLLILDGSVLHIMGDPQYTGSEEDFSDDNMDEFFQNGSFMLDAINNNKVYSLSLSGITAKELIKDEKLQDFWVNYSIGFRYIFNLASKLLNIKELVSIATPATIDQIDYVTQVINDNDFTGTIKEDSIYFFDLVKNKENI